MIELGGHLIEAVKHDERRPEDLKARPVLHIRPQRLEPAGEQLLRVTRGDQVAQGKPEGKVARGRIVLIPAASRRVSR